MTVLRKPAAPFLLLALLPLAAAHPATTLAGPPPTDDIGFGPADLDSFGCDHPLETAARADPMDAGPGERVTLEVDVTNPRSEPGRLVFLNACQAHFRVESIDGTRIFDLAFHRLCPEALSEVLLAGNQALTYRFLWDQTDDRGRPAQAPGEYVLRGYFASADPRCLSDAFTTIAVVGTEPTVRVRPERTSYRPGEVVGFRALLTNFAADPFTFHSRRGCRAFFEILSRDGRITHARGRDLNCPGPLVPPTLQPGETEGFPFRWDQRDEAGHPVPSPGEFVIRAIVPTVEGTFVGHGLIAIRPPDS
jgi:hypothetical protein